MTFFQERDPLERDQPGRDLPGRDPPEQDPPELQHQLVHVRITVLRTAVVLSL